MKIKHLSLRLALPLILLTAWRTAAAPVPARPDVRLLRTPEGGLQPQAAVDGDGTLHLIYLKGEPEACDVYYVRRRAGQTSFSAPLRVNSQPGGAIALGTIRGAQLTLGRGNRAHVAWNGSSRAEPRRGKGPPMLYARLNEGRSAFEPQRNLMTASGSLDGGGSVAADPKGNVFVVWHAFPAGAEEEEHNRAVFIARSADDGKTFAPEQRATSQATGACGCCGLKAMVDTRGRLHVLYRAATRAMDRDVTLLTSRDAGLTFTNQVLDRWRVSTCPMSSMDLAQGFGDTLHAAWDKQGKIQVVSIVPDLPDGVMGFPAEGRGNRKHPACALTQKRGERLVVAWTEDTGWAKGGSVVWELKDFGGSGSVKQGRAAGVPAWSRLATVANHDGGFTIIY